MYASQKQFQPDLAKKKKGKGGREEGSHNVDVNKL